MCSESASRPWKQMMLDRCVSPYATSQEAELDANRAERRMIIRRVLRRWSAAWYFYKLIIGVAEADRRRWVTARVDATFRVTFRRVRCASPVRISGKTVIIHLGCSRKRIIGSDDADFQWWLETQETSRVHWSIDCQCRPAQTPVTGA